MDHLHHTNRPRPHSTTLEDADEADEATEDDDLNVYDERLYNDDASRANSNRSSYLDDKPVPSLPQPRASLSDNDDDEVTYFDGTPIIARKPLPPLPNEGARVRFGRLEGLSNDRLFRNSVINVTWILLWYLFATCLSLYNKWMFSPDYYNFRFPLFVTSIHMVVQFICAGSTLLIIPKLRPKQRPSLENYITKVLPCALATSMDIGLSNLSLKSITLSFYTMCKSSTLAFVLIFAFIFKLEKLRLALVGIILIISTGVLLMVMNETDFVFAGFAEVMTASVLGGLRWSLTQILLERETLGMNNPIASIFFLAPLMAAALFLTSGIVEGFHNIFWNAFFITTAEGLHTFGVILVGGCLAFLMVMSEFFLISRTSVVTLSVCGIFKEVATILISSLTFGDILTPINIAGLCITLLGIGAYNYLKIQQARSGDNRRAGTEARLSANEDPRPRPSMHVYSMVAESTPMLLLDGRMMGTYEDDEDEDDEMESGGAEREALEMM